MFSKIILGPVTVKFNNGVDPPTTPTKRMPPAASNVNDWLLALVPLIVEKLITPPDPVPLVVKVVSD